MTGSIASRTQVFADVVLGRPRLDRMRMAPGAQDARLDFAEHRGLEIRAGERVVVNQVVGADNLQREVRGLEQFVLGGKDHVSVARVRLGTAGLDGGG